MTQDEIRRIVKAEKKRQRLTWRKVTDRSGVPYSTIQNFAIGIRDTSLDVAIRLLDGLGLELCVRRKKHEQ